METELNLKAGTLSAPLQADNNLQTVEVDSSINLTWHEMKLHRLQRAEQKLQRPCVL